MRYNFSLCRVNSFLFLKKFQKYGPVLFDSPYIYYFHVFPYSPGSTVVNFTVYLNEPLDNSISMDELIQTIAMTINAASSDGVIGALNIVPYSLVFQGKFPKSRSFHSLSDQLWNTLPGINVVSSNVVVGVFSIIPYSLVF